MMKVEANTLVYWIIICCSILVGLMLGSSLLQQIFITISMYLLIFAFLEIAYFIGKKSIWNEEEKVQKSYRWFDVYLDSDGKNQHGDLTEGYFKDDMWNVSAATALRQKYDRFFEILNLKSGMKVLDIGCGYGQWMHYLKERGVDSIGITIADVQVQAGREKGLDVRLIDGRKLPKTNEFMHAFDAVTILGCIEHCAKCSNTDLERLEIYRDLMQNAKRASKPNGIILTSTLNVDSDKWTFVDYLKAYILERFYSGRYPVVGEIQKAADAIGLKKVHYSDQTEDYRWISIINPNHFGYFKIKWTPKRVIYILYMFLTNPFATHTWLYHILDIWMWHLGGTERTANRNRYAPCRLKWESFMRV